METETTALPGPGQYGSDRDTFLRVWRRVMPEPGPGCPIQLAPAGQSPAPRPLPGQMGLETEARSLPRQAETKLEPLPDREENGGLAALEPGNVQGDFPSWQDGPCLGGGAMGQWEQMQRLLEREGLLWRRWRGLERRAAGMSQRSLAALGEDCRRRNKRLSTALFLLTGIRGQSPQVGRTAAPRSFLGGMREQFLDTQQQGCTYQAATETCGDACLRALYLDLAGDCIAQAERIREVLEAM
ncbi:MAG: hypothetical protein LUE91_02560 [Oscillospiraceae bacterium]|nr:hypothetical protein [Oscillospiraceae bacterium]